MIKNEEFKRLQDFVYQYDKDEKALTKALQEYQVGIETAHKNMHTFLMERQKWVVKNISVFLQDLMDKYGYNVAVKHITFYNDPERIMRVKFVAGQLITRDYYASNGWCAPSEDSTIQ